MLASGLTSAVHLAAIGDIAEVLPGFSSGGALEHQPLGTHQVVLSRHLTPGLPYRFTTDDEMRITPSREAERYALRRGDVLLMSRGIRNVASWVDDVPEPTIAPVSFFIVRPHADIDPGYIAWYLNSPHAQRAIGEARTGAGTPIVQRSVFAAMEIPVPDLATQRRIGALGELAAREHILRARLAEASTREHAAVNDQITRALIARAHEPAGEDE